LGENRPFIVTNLKIGPYLYEKVEITLTNRDYMGHRMLVGRDSLKEGTLVDPTNSFLVTIGDYDLYHKEIKASQKPLTIALLASNPNLISNKRILEAGENLGHKMLFLNIKDCFLNIQEKDCKIHSKNHLDEEMIKIDAVIPRIKPNATFYGCSLVRQFQTMGKFCLNDANAIANSRDKLKALQILASRCIPMPVTGFGTKETKELIELVGGAPLIIKLLQGTQGNGVILVDSNISASSVISAFKSTHTDILVQEFIRESRGEDIRSFVVDGKVIGSMMRKASSRREFRANFHLGGSIEQIKITPKERKLAIGATKALGLLVAGVDIIRSKRGPLILEVNSSPGLEGIEKATNLDLAKKMIHVIEKTLYGKKK
jgi:ribosomal protein S6--L-glutamate ligase